MSLSTLRLVAFACVVGCSNSSEPPPPAKAPPLTSTLEGKREHGMLNCPSGVDGSKTQMQMSPTDVMLTVTASDPNAQKKIVALAYAQERAGNPHGGLINNGEHNGPGSSGFCPIIHADTTIRVEEVSGGVIIHVRPNDPTQLQTLRQAIFERVKAIGGATS